MHNSIYNWQISIVRNNVPKNIAKVCFILFTIGVIPTWQAGALAASDPYPYMPGFPTVNDILPSPAHVYHCSVAGSNTSGNGSADNPWYDLIGANSGGSGTPVVPGGLVYFHGGTYQGYPYTNFSYSQNRLLIDGTAGAPIVITNFPGEIARWDYTYHWALTLGGDHQVLLGTKANDTYGIKINGGISITGNYDRVSGVEFTSGSSNGGDSNPAMLSVPLNDGCAGLVISHNLFHDSKNQLPDNRMACIRFFNNENSVIEYNFFKDNLELSDCSAVYFKDRTKNATVRNNVFENTIKGVQYFTQNAVGGNHDGLNVSGNLFYNVSFPILFRNEYGPGITIHENIALNIPVDGAFFYYLNADPVYAGADHGQVYDNVIGGKAFQMGYHANSSIDDNLPDIFDYNLWFSASDRNSPWGDQGYYQHDIITVNNFIYDSSAMAATVSDDYQGINAGRYNDTIGGLTWTENVFPSIPTGLNVK